eukprot:6027021-Pleurochrysis_carterae.AAC.6
MNCYSPAIVAAVPWTTLGLGAGQAAPSRRPRTLGSPPARPHDSATPRPPRCPRTAQHASAGSRARQIQYSACTPRTCPPPPKRQLLKITSFIIYISPVVNGSCHLGWKILGDAPDSFRISTRSLVGGDTGTARQYRKSVSVERSLINPTNQLSPRGSFNAAMVQPASDWIDHIASLMGA